MQNVCFVRSSCGKFVRSFVRRAESPFVTFARRRRLIHFVKCRTFLLFVVWKVRSWRRDFVHLVMAKMLVQFDDSTRFVHCALKIKREHVIKLIS